MLQQIVEQIMQTHKILSACVLHSSREEIAVFRRRRSVVSKGIQPLIILLDKSLEFSEENNMPSEGISSCKA